MMNRKSITQKQRSTPHIQRFVKRVKTNIVMWLMRSLFMVNRLPKIEQGFVLSTTVLLLLVLALTVGAITLRTHNRTIQTIGQRQQSVIYNAATPAIDRAKAKIEYLFKNDPRFPSGHPRENQLYGMLINDGLPHGPSDHPITVSQFLTNIEEEGSPVDPYTFPDEENRLDLNLDGIADNAWAYDTDTDGDGEADARVAYSIIFQTPANASDMQRASDNAIADRATALQVRHGPLSKNSSLNPACSSGNNSGVIQDGWFPDSGRFGLLRKNFQVNVFVLPNDANGVVSTLEFHQDRQINEGNKWGAWFRNDLEIFPGPVFNWNGAMHTEGNLIVGGSATRGFLISSPASCLYSAPASEITIADIQSDPDAGIPAFQGQFISGKTNQNNFEGTSHFHIHANQAIIDSDRYRDNMNGQTTTNEPDTKLDTSNDSIQSTTPNVIDLTLDPIALLTQGVSQSRGMLNPATEREPSWDNRRLTTDRRLYNQSEQAPFVDDAFRADNRYGPSPRIKGRKIPGIIGQAIGNELTGGTRSITEDELIRIDSLAGDNEGIDVGLDGYWERRSRMGGLRLLVGERLELGNAHGWGGGIDGQTGHYRNSIADEPLLPWNVCKNSGRCHEARQRRALYDNLAAVQATVIYHSSDSTMPSKDFPTACMATVAHPGSSETLILSSAFKDLRTDILSFIPSTATTYRSHPVVSNFFLGFGTNGWEYEPVPSTVTDEVSYAYAIAPNRPLGIALRNLAYFAGDPKGGTPSFTPVDNTIDPYVHPYPWMSMWGDFSLLRRILALLDGLSTDQGNSSIGVVSYADLSPADKASLHTASCMIGMLAYTIGFFEAIDYTSTDPSAIIELNALEARMNDLLTNTNLPSSVNPVSSDEVPEAFVAALKRWHLEDSSAVPQKIVSLAEIILLKEQVNRDRQHGFYSGAYHYPPDQINPLAVIGHGNLLKLTTTQPKFPPLHYLFPNDIAGIGGLTSGSPIPDGIINASDTVIEQEINQGEYSDPNLRIRDAVIKSTNHASANYKALDLTDEIVLNNLVVYPKRIDHWKLPHQNAGTGDTTLSNEPNGVRIGCLDTLCGGHPESSVFRLVEVGFKDTVTFNGRELLPTRVMDVNIDLIRQSTSGLTGDSWLPNTGIIYGFREDAVREDEITRPTTGGSWITCSHDAAFASANSACSMKAGVVDAFQSTDPPLNDENRISPKSVDYYPDPDRRPHGFRLRNGKQVWRATDRESRGLSFITDNPVYIMGDFNLHQTSGGERLEEFTQLLTDNFSNFYSRHTLDHRFARPNDDLWRPSEILADAITIVSDVFCDGSVEDITYGLGGSSNSINLDNSLVINRYGCKGSSQRTSFLNTPLLKDNVSEITLITGEAEHWHHLNPYHSLFNTVDWTDRLRVNAPITPIVWSRHGNPILANGLSEYGGRYYEISTAKSHISPPDNQDNRVNVIMISGIVPSRGQQAYGGLHNFPRFIEDWKDKKLHISGSLIQLNFSHYATAPYDQDAWESGNRPRSAQFIKYYRPPLRRWGYDVALQYAPAGPLASRFVSIGTMPRSEFYSEPPANDPYLAQLCQQIADSPESQCVQ